MDILLFISQFLYRIRYWLLWGTLFVTGLVIYFTQFLPYSYTVKSSLYAGYYKLDFIGWSCCKFFCSCCHFR